MHVNATKGITCLPEVIKNTYANKKLWSLSSGWYQKLIAMYFMQKFLQQKYILSSEITKLHPSASVHFVVSGEAQWIPWPLVQIEGYQKSTYGVLNCQSQPYSAQSSHLYSSKRTCISYRWHLRLDLITTRCSLQCEGSHWYTLP